MAAQHTHKYMENIATSITYTLLSYPKNISAVKKGKPKKVQVTEWPKDVISL